MKTLKFRHGTSPGSACAHYHTAEVAFKANNCFQKDEGYKICQRLRKGKKRELGHVKAKEPTMTSVFKDS